MVGTSTCRTICNAGLVAPSWSFAPDSYKKGLDRLRAKYSQGLEFIVLTPVFLTLRQQTLQRLKDAGLKNSNGSDPRVLSYKFSANTTVSNSDVLPMLTYCTVISICWCSGAPL